MIKLILAVDKSNKLGFSNGDLAYRIKADLQRFKKLTSIENNNFVLMGKNTFDSLKMKNGLPNRINLVLTSKNIDSSQYGENVIFFNDIESALNFSNHNLWIIGGAKIYEQFLPICDEIYLTQIHENNNEADIALKTDLYNWKLFTLEQQKKNIFWDSQVFYPNKEDILVNEPNYTFINLMKN